MSQVFDEIIELPRPEIQSKFNSLIGLDEVKERLLKEGELLLKPKLIDDWSKTHYDGKILSVVKKFHDRPPLIVFSGDVGTGKTTLADSFGDSIARKNKVSIRVMRVSLKARGNGAVGEMTRLITQAFEEVEGLAKNNPSSAIIMIVDEADALAQSRELNQMHHEDRAGVNALIRGIDHLTAKKLPVIVVMCTNRIEAIDPAVMRRASAQYVFKRPNTEQRKQVLDASLGEIFGSLEIEQLVEATGPTAGKAYGYTYSDINQRLIPQMVLNAYPDNPLNFEAALQLAKEIEPTKPFGEEIE